MKNSLLEIFRALVQVVIKKVFTEDIDMIELLLAHAIPEGIANISIPFAILVLMFVVDYRLALLPLFPFS